MNFTQVEAASGRMVKSAYVLKAYFEQRFKAPIELLNSKPDDAPESRCVAFHRELQALGLWGCQAAIDLSLQDKEEISHTFQTILGTMGRLDRQQSDVARLQQRLEDVGGETPANVIPFRRTSDLRRNGLSTPSKSRRAIKHDCLIESAHVSDIHKLALELHTHSDRYAFLEFRDLNSRSRRSLADLASLGCVSLFLPDVMALQPDEQLVLKDLVQLDSATRPVLLAGSTVPFSDLRRESSVNNEFIMRLSQVYFKLTRPFLEYKREGLIQYFLDTLSEDPT
jgi:hypothetical protein